MPARAGPIELDLPQQVRMVQALRGRLRRDCGGDVTLIETHISFVLVAGDRAYKVKKAVDLGFLDFTTLAARRRCCDDELRLNRRLAPSLYLGVRPITGPVGSPRIGADGPAIDWAVEMVAFAQDGLWDRLARCGELSPRHIDELVDLLARFHRDAAVAGARSPFGRAERIRAPMRDNLDALAALPLAPDVRDRLERLRRWEAAAFDALRPVFAQRARAGWIRECHGDLHLGNVTRFDGRTTVFDCIEFNEAFRWIDVVSEVAFMAMDLHHHGLPALAHRFVDASLQRSGDYAGARLLRYYLVYRALVRAKVAALRAGQAATDTAAAAAASACIGLADRFADDGRAALLITHGLSGSGKTTATAPLVEAIGALRIRADVERKRLAGLGETERSGSGLGAGLYTAEATARTYRRLLALAEPVLRGGLPVVLDATFLKHGQRAGAAALADRLGVPFVILDFDLGLATLRERIEQRAARADDASEADAQVLLAQHRSAEALSDAERAVSVRCTPTADPGSSGPAPAIDWRAMLRGRVPV